MTNGILFRRCRRAVFQCLVRLVHINMVSLFLVFALTIIPTLGESHQATDIPIPPLLANLTQHASNLSHNTSRRDRNSTGNGGDKDDDDDDEDNPIKVPNTAAHEMGIPREFPTALVIASSIAAVCIIVFFVASYIWHTRQLDSRARKLAIRMAADSEHAMRCANCTPPPRPINRSYTRAISESSQEPNMCEALNPEEDHDQPITLGSEGGRSSIVVSESDTADMDDIFDETEFPPPMSRGSKLGSRSSRGAHRKWSRSSRKSSGPASLDGKRDSAVTDKEILSHFANRRHSTFFI